MYSKNLTWCISAHGGCYCRCNADANNNVIKKVRRTSTVNMHVSGYFDSILAKSLFLPLEPHGEIGEIYPWQKFPTMWYYSALAILAVRKFSLNLL